MILGLYILVFALIDIPQIMMAFSWARSTTGQQQHAVFLMSAISSWGRFALEIVLGLLLFTKAARISAWMTPQVSEPQSEVKQLTLGDYLYAGFLTIGMYALVRGLVGIASLTTIAVSRLYGPETTDGNVTINMLPNQWSDVARIIVGLALIIGSRSLIKALKVNGSISRDPVAEDAE
jgi:hypothetical protein